MSIRSADGAGAAGSDAKERRASGGQRVHFEALIAVGEGAGGGFEAESVDVSPDGMRMRTAYLPKEGDKLICRFDGMGTEIVAEGQVAWLREESKGGEFGLRFVGLDEATAAAVRAMCMTLGDPGDPENPADQPAMPKGSRVRLHIEGLGSPMKARVRDGAAKEVQVGSNLEFLKVGRALELEDVEAGAKREATIDDVKVDVDPATNVPQLVVTLRFEKGGAEKAAPEKKREKAKPAAAPARKAEASPAREETKNDAEPEEGDATEPNYLGRAVGAGKAAAEKIGPALAGMGSRAKGAMGSVIDLVQKRRAERAATIKAAAPRRMTAPPPGGALTAEGRRLVRDEPMEEDEPAATPRSNRRAAATGGALGLLAVLAIFGVTRIASRGHVAAAPPAAEARTAVAALPPAPEPIAAPGTPTANVPLFGATPLSTTEPAAPAPTALASASPSSNPGAAMPGADTGEDEPAPSGGGNLKEWGQGTVAHPIVLKIKMDGSIDHISGASGAQGFTISVPGRRSISSGTELARKDKRLSSVNVVNSSKGAEITVQFKDGVPPYLAKIKGDRLEIAIGKEGHSKIAKKRKKKHSND